MIITTKIDDLLEAGDSQEAYDLLKESLQQDKDNFELLWRLAKACHMVASSLGKKLESKKKELILEGRDAGLAAYKISNTNFDVLMWLAVLSGELSDYLGTKERIQEGHKFKEYLDEALAMKPADYALLHMRGRFSYSVANLSWLERKAATAFFRAEPPTATIDEALRDFEESDRLKPEWMENLYYLARCYLDKGNKECAVKYLKIAEGLEACDDGERDMQAEVRKLIQKNSK
uniref:TPR_REGION domain-containing protein n=1 Tax=Steinernema glaseri TaxID=37863 RepID=A0A1I7Y447_9BILA